VDDKRPCNNCGDPNWAAKNDNFCTSCESEWYRVMKLTVMQAMMEKILNRLG